MIVLIGFMGTGKTTVGRMVAARLGLPFIDTDEAIEQRQGRSIRQIFEESGEPAFREIEREVVLAALGGDEAVVALGGGALGDPVVAALLQGKTVVHLKASWAEIQRRLRGDTARPLLRRHDPRALYEERSALYEMVGTLAIDTDDRSVADIALEIAIAVAGASAAEEHTQRVAVPLGDRSYEIVVGRDLVTRFDEFVPSLDAAEKAFLLGHPSTERFLKELSEALGARGVEVHVLTIPEGESSKSLSTIETLWDDLARREAHRADLVVGVGGGVVCDVAGFVAATYSRGLKLAHVPTTLLAQVDAAIGGKCGVNIPAGKNLIGAIYQPSVVLCDVDVLASLPQEELRSGMAEVVKYGFIADPESLSGMADTAKRLYDGDGCTTVSVVTRAAATKASFVATDERDFGRRAFLNYGHTFAHAIERLSGYGGIRHGEAVALGMMAAAYLSHELGRLSEYGVALHKRILDDVGLPTSAELDAADLQAAWKHDKKYDGGVRFVLLNDIGIPESGIAAPTSAIRAALERMSP
ncbi:MAG: 3-dehydroquinate synthase [Actinomycetota bacterium]